jgi:DNA-binding LacI/PurR family transcriptional regulator
MTIRDVARESGYSASTVSVVLNSAPLSRRIPAKTRRHIERTAGRLGYRPNGLARVFHNQRSNVLGVLVFDITDPCCAPIIRGIENSVYHTDYLSLLTDANNEPHRFERNLGTMLDRRVEGLVVVPNRLVQNINLLGTSTQRQVPKVIVGCEMHIDTVSTVSADNEAGARSALELLHRLGHRDIAFIRGPKTLASSSQRWRGIQNFTNEAGIRLDQKRIAELPTGRTCPATRTMRHDPQYTYLVAPETPSG